MAFLDLLNKTAAIARYDDRTAPARTFDRTQSLTQIETSTPIALQAASATEVETYQKRSIDITHTGYLLPTIAVDEGDLVTVDSIEYRVQAVEDKAGRGHHLQIKLFRKETT